MFLQIIKVEYSPTSTKRFRVFLNNGDTYDYGDKNAETFLDHHSTERRQRYQDRHLANPQEKHLIENIIPSPALFSYYLSWGRSVKIQDNIKDLNKLFIYYRVNK